MINFHKKIIIIITFIALSIMSAVSPAMTQSNSEKVNPELTISADYGEYDKLTSTLFDAANEMITNVRNINAMKEAGLPEVYIP